MKPPPFDYLAPESLEEATALLAEHGEEAKLLAGGQSLVPLLNFRLLRPAVIIDLNRVPELSYLRQEDGDLVIGAMTRHRTVEESPVVGGCRMVPEALALVGHVAIRNRGTVGGSVAHADPAAEWPPLLLALDGRCRLAGHAGTRTVPAEELFVDYLTTAIEPVEILTEIRLTLPPPGAGSSFLEVARRHGDFAQAGVAAVVSLSGGGAVSEARIALMGVAPTAVRAPAAEAVLAGEAPSEALLAAAAEAVDEAIDPLEDVHGSADYKRHLARVLTERALAEACRRAEAGQAGETGA